MSVFILPSNAANGDKIELCQYRIQKNIYALGWQSPTEKMLATVKAKCNLRYEPGEYEALTPAEEDSRNLWEYYTTKLIVLRATVIEMLKGFTAGGVDDDITPKEIQTWRESIRSSKDIAREVRDLVAKKAFLFLNKEDQVAGYIYEDYVEFIKDLDWVYEGILKNGSIFGLENASSYSNKGSKCYQNDAYEGADRKCYCNSGFEWDESANACPKPLEKCGPNQYLNVFTNKCSCNSVSFLPSSQERKELEANDIFLSDGQCLLYSVYNESNWNKINKVSQQPVAVKKAGSCKRGFLWSDKSEKCVQANSYCKKIHGKKAKYDSKSKSCSCSAGYLFGESDPMCVKKVGK